MDSVINMNADHFNKSWSDNYDINDAMTRIASPCRLYLSSYTADGVRTAINNKLGDYAQWQEDKTVCKKRWPTATTQLAWKT